MKFLHFFKNLLPRKDPLTCQTLLGTWQSSKELSMDYNNSHAHLEKIHVELLNQILGYMTVTYTKTKVRQHGHEAIPVSLNNDNHDFQLDDISYPYKVSSIINDITTIKCFHPSSGTSGKAINFVGEDVYWTIPEEMPTSREYFIRICKNT